MRRCRHPSVQASSPRIDAVFRKGNQAWQPHSLQNAVVVTAVLLLLGISGVAADKPRPWRPWPDNGPWAFNMPSARAWHTMVKVADGSLWMFGGRRTSEVGEDDCPDTLAKLDIEAQQWTPITPAGPSPSPRSGHAATAVDYDMYVNGNGEFWKLSTLELKWTQISYAGTEMIQWTTVTGRISSKCKRPAIGREIKSPALASILSTTTNTFDRQTWDRQFGNLDLQDGDFICPVGCCFSYHVKSPQKAHPEGPLATVGHDIYTFDMRSRTNGLMKFDTQTNRWTLIETPGVYPPKDESMSGWSLTAVSTSLYLVTRDITTDLGHTRAGFWRFDTVSRVWTSLDVLSFMETSDNFINPFCGGSLTTNGQDIYFLTDNVVVWKFDTVSNQWTEQALTQGEGAGEVAEYGQCGCTCHNYEQADKAAVNPNYMPFFGISDQWNGVMMQVSECVASVEYALSENITVERVLLL